MALSDAAGSVVSTSRLHRSLLTHRFRVRLMSAAVAISDAAGCGTAATGRAGNGCLSLVPGEVEESPKISFSRIPPWFPEWLCFFSVRVENASGAIRSAKVVFVYTSYKQMTST